MIRALSALSLLAATSALAADPPPHITARLDYVPAQGCPPASVLRVELARRLGYDPFVEAAPLRVVATITRGKNALVGSVEFPPSITYRPQGEPRADGARSPLPRERHGSRRPPEFPSVRAHRSG